MKQSHYSFRQRYKSATLSVAGISEVKAPGIENVNLSDEISQVGN
jgi:hypothetical protein